MFYNPFFELIERFIKWLSSFGGITYWVWVLTVAILTNVAIQMWLESYSGWHYWLVATLSFFALGMPIVVYYEKKRKGK